MSTIVQTLIYFSIQSYKSNTSFYISHNNNYSQFAVSSYFVFFLFFAVARKISDKNQEQVINQRLFISTNPRFPGHFG